jgi:hypothetical protein
VDYKQVTTVKLDCAYFVFKVVYLPSYGRVILALSIALLVFTVCFLALAVLGFLATIRG